MIDFLLFWFVCGFLTYGFSFGTFQGNFPNIKESYYKDDVIFSFMVAVTGPIGLIAFFIAALRTKQKVYFKLK